MAVLAKRLAVLAKRLAGLGESGFVVRKRLASVRKPLAVPGKRGQLFDLLFGHAKLVEASLPLRLTRNLTPGPSPAERGA